MPGTRWGPGSGETATYNRFVVRLVIASLNGVAASRIEIEQRRLGPG